MELGSRSIEDIKQSLSGNTDEIGQYLQDMSNRSDSQEDQAPRQRRRCDFGQSSGSDNDDDESTGMHG